MQSKKELIDNIKRLSKSTDLTIEDIVEMCESFFRPPNLADCIIEIDLSDLTPEAHSITDSCVDWFDDCEENEEFLK